MVLSAKQRDSDAENKYMDTKGEWRWGGIESLRLTYTHH